jgi:tetratricopeptide (TPR) repeat protein
MPAKAPLGSPIPITYKWLGNWQELQDGIVLLTWQKIGGNKNQKWIDDHAIGMGNLHSGNLQKEDLSKDFQVIENTAMFPNTNLSQGIYTLKATYLNRKTGESYPLEIGTTPSKIILDNNLAPLQAPELDLVSQLQKLAPNLAYGLKGLDSIFAEISRINQYDPLQDYLQVSQKALDFRLQNEQNLEYLYTVVLAQVLQQDTKGAIASLKQLIKIDPNNAYNHAYLAFVYLYDWQGKEGEKALQPALKLNPEITEFKILDGIAALMQGNLIKAWQIYQKVAK